MIRLVLLLLLTTTVCAPAISAPAGKAHVDPAKVRRELRQILSSREYNVSTQKSFLEKWTDRAGKAIARAWRSFVAWIFRHLRVQESSGAGFVALIGAWLVVLGFLVMVGLVIRKLIGSRSARAREDADDADVSYEMPTARLLIKQAGRLAESGDYRGAFRSAYVASIAYLDEIRALRFERSRTNWEYMRELKSGGHDRPYGELHPLTRDFDRKVYGRESCSEQDYLNAAAAYERLSSEEAR